MRRIPLALVSLSAVTVLVVAAVLVIVRQNVTQTRALRDHNNLVVHTYELQRRLDEVRLHVAETESAARGLLLTPGAATERYDTARRNLAQALSELTTLSTDTAAQVERAGRLRAAVNARLAIFDQVLSQRDAAGLEAGLAVGRTDDARRVVSEIQALATEIESEQNALLATRRVQVDTAYRSAIRGRVGSGILSAALIVVVVVLAFAHARSRQRRELELVKSERRARDAATVARKARAEAERANELKDEFLAILSHELRTPLNAVLGWAQILESSQSVEPALRRAVSSIRRNAEAQQRLVEDLLDVSRIVTGKFPLQSRAFELRTSVSAAVDALRPAAQAKGVDVQVVLNGPAVTKGDPDRIQQVAANLLSNAIKFTPEGGRVDVTLNADNGHAELIVHDTGCGISPDLKPFVFDRFRTGDGSTTRAHGGLGLGLAIAKHIVDAHGGSIEARSDGAGQGATFRVRLPAA